MFIQSAELTAAPGKSSELGPKVDEMRDFLSAQTDTEWSSWVVLAGRPFGTRLLTTRWDGFADMVAGQMKFAGSSDWASLSGSLTGILAQPAETYLNEVIAVTGEPGPPKPFTTVTRASMGGTDMQATMAWSTKVMEHVTKTTGNGGLLLMSTAGRMFDVGWVSGSDTAEDMDTFHQAISEDADYAGMMAEATAAELFVDGSAERMILVKMP